MDNFWPFFKDYKISFQVDEVEVETTGKNCLVYNLQSKKFYVCNMIQFANVNTVTVSLGFIVRNTVDKKL